MSQPSQGLTPSSQSQSGRQRAPQCVRCGSRTWMRDRNRGVMICSEGHVLEGYIRESTVQTEISQHSTRVRRVRVGKVKKEYVLKDVYTNEHERLLLLQIYTILIRKQTEVLIKVLRAPPVLENVVNSLWRAYLNTLSLPPIRLLSSRSFSPTSSCFPTHSQSGYSSEDSRFTDARSRFSSPAIPPDGDSGLPLTPETLKAMTEDELSSSDDSDRRARFLPPQSDDESQHTSQTGDSRSATGKKRRQRRLSKELPRMDSTLGILYLACTRLRLPIMMHDLINLICSKELPYIGFMSEIPDHLKAKASRATITLLSMQRPPRLYQGCHRNGLASTCYKLASDLRKREEELLPTKDCIINVPLIALRFSQMLLIPPPIHALALHITSKLDPIFFGFIGSSKMKPKPGRKKEDTDFQFPPDWVLMACLVSTIQIGLEGIKNHPNHSDPVYELVKKSLPRLKNWIEAMVSLRNSIDHKNPQRLCG
ncbi:uncharacterized protein MELLADRAFT_93713 [Melampsora larici-populina 98AG31]|uniref:Rrn7/TAF1B N-terminal cyclin domain-containing protein n=1 Tax=Melampsora larici-populina (strain 98AG31 / pathotype 3-4-7) TaxID=747676 RepID=F4S501_MELLP|nr:uncharacterized protein MELLADRAFT_93713 [Melampsora larici-populina 98AG31]EGG00291.1 hypothetical protein MELLADRAFT_93713 [Melampsora larici-populina 98AG31]